MSRFKLCFIFDEAGDYKPVPYSKLMDGNDRRPEYADRYFIPLNGYLLEVSHEDYLDHYKTANRQGYLRKEAKRAGEISLQAMEFNETDIVDEIYADVAEQVIEEMMKASLHKALVQLSEDEQRIIHLIYFEGQPERQCAEIIGVSRNAVHERKIRILKKLKNSLSV